MNTRNTSTTQINECLHTHMNADEYKSIYYYIYAWIHKNVHKKAQKSKKNLSKKHQGPPRKKKIVLIFLKLYVSWEI